MKPERYDEILENWCIGDGIVGVEELLLNLWRACIFVEETCHHAPEDECSCGFISKALRDLERYEP